MYRLLICFVLIVKLFFTLKVPCVTVYLLLGVFGHARTFLRYHLSLFYCFRAREILFALPFIPFLLFPGTREPSRVTIYPFFTVFGQARSFLRYRLSLFCCFRARENPLALPFIPFYCFRARENPLALPFIPFLLFPGTREPSRVTVYPFFAVFGHARTYLCHRLFYLFYTLSKPT
jgi:hypothetical protein